MSEHHRPSEAERKFVEEFALLIQQAGLTRMAGRILAWLLICEPPQQSIGQMAESLSASKSAISTSLRFLIQPGLVEILSPVGQRRDVFVIKPGIWRKLTEAYLAQLSIMRQLAERGLALLEDEPPERLQRLEGMRSMFAFAEDVLPELLERWEAEEKK